MILRTVPRGTWFFPLAAFALAIIVLQPVLATARAGETSKLPLKVFLLAGQSNMEGQGAVHTLDWLGEDPDYGHLLEKVKASDGACITRDDVWVYYPRARGGLKKGNLTVGFGANDEKIGPELLFGHVMGDHFENPVLLIKAAWGGKSLAVDFRPPSAGGEVGPYYRDMLQIVDDVLANLEEHFPQYDGRGYELAGFVWFQGWNDLVSDDRRAEYESNLVHLIHDVRRDLKRPDLPVVIGELGVGGVVDGTERGDDKKIAFRESQAAAVGRPEFQGNVALVQTSKYWDVQADTLLKQAWIQRKWIDEEAHQQFNKMGNQPPYHYLGNAKIFSLVGYGFAEAMKELGP